MNNKKLIRLTEADLHRIVKESVNEVLTQGGYNFNKMPYLEKYYTNLKALYIELEEIISMHSELEENQKMDEAMWHIAKAMLIMKCEVGD